MKLKEILKEIASGQNDSVNGYIQTLAIELDNLEFIEENLTDTAVFSDGLKIVRNRGVKTLTEEVINLLEYIFNLSSIISSLEEVLVTESEIYEPKLLAALRDKLNLANSIYLEYLSL